MAVISVPDQIADRLEPSDDSSGPSYIDYSERRSLPISIPDYQAVQQNGEKFVVRIFDICLFASCKEKQAFFRVLKLFLNFLVKQNILGSRKCCLNGILSVPPYCAYYD